MYKNAHIDKPIIPVIKPAFPILLLNFLADFTPKIKAIIPLGIEIYQKVENIIEIIPSTREIICITLPFAFSSIFYLLFFEVEFIFNSLIKSKLFKELTFIAFSEIVYKSFSIYNPRSNFELLL